MNQVPGLESIDFFGDSDDNHEKNKSQFGKEEIDVVLKLENTYKNLQTENRK